MIRLPKPAGFVPSALLFLCAVAVRPSIAAPVPPVPVAASGDLRMSLPFVHGTSALLPLAGGETERPSPSLPPNAADGTWQEFNLLQVASPIAVYDGAHDRLLTVGGLARFDNWALSLARPPAWQPLPSASEQPVYWSSTVDPSTGLVYYLTYVGTNFEVHTLDPRTGAVTVIPGSALPFVIPRVAWMAFDPASQRLIVFVGPDPNTFPFGEGQVWALDLMPTPTWSQWHPTGTPPPPFFGTFIMPSPAVVDPVRRRIVYPVTLSADFGNSPPHSIWTLTLDGPPRWLSFETNDVPDSTALGDGLFSVNPLAYDGPGDRLVTVSGQGELLALSLATFQWSATPPRNPGPAPRASAGIAIDLVRRRLLVCGGMPPSLIGDTFSDAWALSLDNAPVWSKLVPDAMRAPIRGAASDGYDASRRRMVVFGGSDERGGFRNDTWVVDVRKDPAWAPLSTRGAPPPPRYWHVSAWDPRRDQLIVYGGFNGDPNHPFADLWSLSFAHGTPTWSQLTPPGPAPSGRMLSQLVYDSTRDRFLLILGSDGLHFLDDVWELRLASSPAWRRLAPTGLPPAARAAHMCVYDPARDRVLLFGGGNDPHTPLSGLLNDLWALELGAGDGHWQELPIAPGPSVRSLGLLRLDTNHDRALLFGGFGLNRQATYIELLNDTWALDLSGTPTWRELAPAGFLPPARDRANGAYDAALDRLVLACGFNANDLWTLTFPNAPAAALSSDGAGPQGSGTAQVIALGMSAASTGGRVTFAVQLPTGDPATLALFDIAGRSVWSTPVGQLGAGAHEVAMSGSELPPAIYFARLSQGRATRYARIAITR